MSLTATATTTTAATETLTMTTSLVGDVYGHGHGHEVRTGKDTGYPHCDSSPQAENEYEDAQTRIAELEEQVRFLNDKAVETGTFGILLSRLHIT